MKDSYENTINSLFDSKEWVSSMDFTIATGGSPKFTSRISDMRKKGYVIDDRWRVTENGARIKEYKRKMYPVAS